MILALFSSIGLGCESLPVRNVPKLANNNDLCSHCATHQIRLILISGLVITSLFYPALSIYSSSRFKPLSHVPAQLLGILSPGTPSLAYFQDDLDNVWSGLSALRVWQDAVTRARCGVERTIRLERLLVTSTAIEDTGVINKQTLSSALHFEEELTRHLSSLPHLYCLARSGHECIAISPLEFWAHDHDKLLTDPRVVHTVNTNANMSVAGLPFNLRMVFAGRETSENSDAFVNFATHLSIVYMFLENDCSGSAGHEAWLQALEDVVPPSVELVTKPQGPQLLALQVSSIPFAQGIPSDVRFNSSTRIKKVASKYLVLPFWCIYHTFYSSFITPVQCGAWTLCTRVSVYASPAWLKSLSAQLRV